MGYAEVLTALADPTRRGIFEALRAQPATVGELARSQPVSRPAVSQHLKILADARLVQARAEGRQRIYSIRREGLDDLRGYVDGFWSDVLSAFAAEVERRVAEVEPQVDE